MFGWSRVSSASNDTLNLELADFQLNGKYCKTGFAHPIDDYTARCAQAANISGYTGTNTTAKILDKPYYCDPT